MWRLQRQSCFIVSCFTFGVTPVLEAEGIALETGAVACLEWPPGQGPFSGAVFFHGDGYHGSMQSSAVAIRRALLDAGYLVLSVDQPGYGQSPGLSLDADAAEWNPLPTAVAAVKVLQSRSGVSRVFVLGHSMGSLQMLRLLSTQSGIAGAVLFGAALAGVPIEFDEARYERFHNKRRIQARIPRNRYPEIENLLYYVRPLLESLDSDHPRVYSVRFGHEWSDVRTRRDALYEAIPGRKTLWGFVDSAHYFNSKLFGDLIAGDTRIAQELGSRLRDLVAG